MLHATPTSETKADTAQGKTQVVAQPERELHPHLLNGIGRYSSSSISGIPSGVSPNVQHRQTLAGMQQARGNQATLRMLNGPQQVTRVAPLRPSQGIMLQRKCACGGSPEAGGECEECKAKRDGMLQIQTKLVINEPGDTYEQEADRISDQVMRMPEANLSLPSTHARLSRKCATCEEDLQRAAISPLARGGQPAPQVVHQVLSEPGRPLDPESRAFFEPRFGLNLGHVRIHDDAQAGSSARAIGAHAYTVGSHIALANTVSQDKRRLLAHELVHVVQQTNNVAPQLARDDAPYTPSGPSGALANAADRIAEYRNRATTALSSSGLAEADAGRIRSNLATCADGEERLRSVSQTGDDAASASVLSTFTFDSMRQVIPSLTRVQPAPKAVAVNEASNGELATMPTSGADFSRPMEREAERVAAKLVPTGALALASETDNVLRRYLNQQQVQETEEVVRQAVPVIGPTVVAGVAAAATAPLWVWIVVAVVIVAAAAAVLYWVFSDNAPKSQPQEQPKPQPESQEQPKPQPESQEQPKPQPQPPRKDRNMECSQVYPHLNECYELELLEDYQYSGLDLESAGENALSKLKRSNPKARLEAYNEAITETGPCPGQGAHINVRDLNQPPNDNYFGSIVCCPCCLDEPTGPELEARCGFKPH